MTGMIIKQASAERGLANRKSGIGCWEPSSPIPNPQSLIPSHIHPSSFCLLPSAFRLLPSPFPRPSPLAPRPSSRAYSLIELLVAMTIALILLAAVVEMFAKVGESITDSRSMLEASERARLAAARLQMDLQGVTATMSPPRSPEDGEGYFEYIEGPVMQRYITQKRSDYDWDSPGAIRPKPLNSQSIPSSDPNIDTSVDTSVGDFDDILMFTTRSTGKPFMGKYNNNAVQSDVAEVVWFIRGRTLHRRQLLIRPDLDVAALGASGFYAKNDISVRLEGANLVANTLGDLTRRKCRFGHLSTGFPFSASVVLVPPTPVWGDLGLPTLRECSDNTPPAWNAGVWNGSATTYTNNRVDFWANSGADAPFSDSAIPDGSGPGNTFSGTRIADDVILTNVIGFDVKAWDPTANGGAGQYVDLGGAGSSTFSGFGDPRSLLQGSVGTARVYDTWSTHYENIGLAPGFANAGRSTNGFDDDGNGIVDDENEKLTSAPYPYPLRGIQVKIRYFEPDSRQVRELTVVQDFLAE
ncbi:MAG: PilW family protein [Thermoguttaceae bacterium]